MASKALYFPYIRVPEDEWFTRALLYWDKVGTILPDGLENDPRYVTPWMASLLEAEQLEPVSPYYTSSLPRFAETFLEFLDRDDEVQSRLAQPLREFRFVHVHVGKLGELADALEERGLARRLERPGPEVWLDVEARTADLYMAYLAGALGNRKELGMDPLT